MPTYTLTQGDLEPPLVLQLMDGAAPVDLSQAVAVEFSMANSSGQRAYGPMQVQDARTGMVAYHWRAGETSWPGLFNATVRVTWPGGRPQTFPSVRQLQVSVQRDTSR